MTRPTVPAVSAEAQAARGWPRPGTRVRVTRTHTSGLVETTEGVAADGDWDEDRTTYWLLLNEGAGEVALTSDDVWTVTWEELEPVPSPVLPPEPTDAPRKRRRGDDLPDPSQPLGIRIAARLTERERANETSSRSAWEDLAISSAVFHRGMAEAYANARDIVAEECQRTPVRPVSEVVDRADAQELVLAARTGTTAAHPYGCGAGPDETCRDNDCDAWRALLARFAAPGVTA